MGKINEKNHEFITCRGVFEPKKKREFYAISQTHLENVDFKNFPFWTGLLVGEFSKINQKNTTLSKFILMDFRQKYPKISHFQ